MKIRVPIMIQDPAISATKGMAETENVDIEDEFFLDGPVSRQLAILNFDPATGALHEGAKFVPPARDRVLGSYDVDPNPNDPLFFQVSVYATIMKTIELYERPDVLGRPVRWGFPGPQLLVVPRAGEWANAFYERSSRSLQFFYFSHKGGTVHTALSRDIVAHETGHAVLDGVAPDLLDAITPQALALHESIADLTALLMAFASPTLRQTVLEQNQGSIKRPSAFNLVAEEFGNALKGGRPLRNFDNNASLVAGPDLEVVSRTQPHELSQVMSGALFPVMLKMHEEVTAKFEAEGMDHLAASGRALGICSIQFGRIMLRALDYLPPGEVSFRDYAWAVVASDMVSNPDQPGPRDVLMEEFTRRGVPIDANAVASELDIEAPQLDQVDRGTLVESDWAAFDFVTRNRDLFNMPADVPFRLRPRLDVTKTYYAGQGEKQVRELIFKVSWDAEEDNPIGRSYPAKRTLTVGTTLAIAWDQPRIRARLTHELTVDQARDRTDLLRQLDAEGTLIPGRPVTIPQVASRRVIGPLRSGDTLRLAGTGLTLHIAGPWSPPLEETP
jgi:hypothetical protein